MNGWKTEKDNFVVYVYGPGMWFAAGISYYFNGFTWLTIGNMFLGWCYVAHKVLQIILG